MGTIICETDRLILRHLEWSDIDALHALMSDPDVMRYVGNGSPKTRQQTERLMEFWIDDNRRACDEHTLERLPQLRRAVEQDAHFPCGRRSSGERTASSAAADCSRGTWRGGRKSKLVT